MTAFRRVGVLGHPLRPQTEAVADHISETLRARALDVWTFARWTETEVAEHIPDTDLLVAIGGDGAMLRAARVGAAHQVPVLGVNTGRLGFLTEIDGPDRWEAHLEPLLAGRYWIEERMMLCARVWRGGDESEGGTLIAQSDALNDAVLTRTASLHMTRFDTYIDHEWTTTYNADALIISTATGSTAYALACGGPILPPELRGILIVPVAPHLTLDRPIVLPDGAVVEVIVSPDREHETILACDGALLCDLRSGDLVRIVASKDISRFVRLRERNYFYRSLLDRLEPRISVPETPLRKQL